MHLLCSLIIKVECQSSLILEAFACGLRGMENHAVVAVKIISIFLLCLIVVVLGFLVENFRIFKGLTGLVCAVFSDLLLKAIDDSVGQGS